MSIRKFLTLFALLTLAGVILVACGGGAATEAPAAEEPAAGDEGGDLSADLLGAGASFPNPIYLEWISEYTSNVRPDVSINYQSIGSGGGVEQFIGQQTDFGASDAFLSEEEFDAATEARGCTPVHIPTVFGAVSLGYNLEGVDSLTLSGPVLADIYFGNIANWSDPAIAELNPDVTLPDEDIIVAHRSDGSGTTSIFTTYLSSVSDEWASGPGAGKEVEWPAPNSVGGEKNDGVAAQIQQNPGAIGYIELSYAMTNDIPVADMINEDGNAITPTLESTAAAADGIEIPDDLRFNILNVGGEGYPIAGATWILAWTCGYDDDIAAALKDWVTWDLTEGDDLAMELLYSPLPDSLQARALEKVDMINSGTDETMSDPMAEEEPAEEPAAEEPAEEEMAELSGDLLGAGASFPNPIYLEWISEYTSNVQPDVSINYQSIGSGGGVEQFIGQQTDFGASDAFLSEEEFDAATEARGCTPVHIPTVFGAVSLGYNLEGVDSLTLSGPVLADMFLGNVTNWSDPAIAELNPDVTLPDEDIIIAHRSDGSGTTSIFTTYLSSVSDDWANGPGAGKEVEWPAPNSVGGEKNDGVAAQIQQNPGAIGYIELSYAMTNDIPVADMINEDGNAITPTLESTAAAADGIEIPDDLRFNILNVGGEGYPIAGATWILAWTCGYEDNTAAMLQDWITWDLTEGDDLAMELLYSPLPDSLQARALEKVNMINSED